MSKLVKSAAVNELLAKGYTQDQIDTAFQTAGRNVMDRAYRQAGYVHLDDAATPDASGKTLLERIKDWLLSDQGKAVIAALVAIIMALLTK